MSALNPHAEEWRPAPLHQPHLIYNHPAPLPPSLHTAVLSPSTPPHYRYYQLPPPPPLPTVYYHHHPLYFQGFNTTPCPIYHLPPPLLPPPPPISGAAEQNVAPVDENVGTDRSVTVNKSPPRMRQVRRPKIPRCNNGVAGSCAASSSSSSSSKQPRKKLSSPYQTTLMIRNIPNQLRRDFMLEFLDGYCREYSWEYDAFYLPIDFSQKGNKGYAFVNFTTIEAAQGFKKIVQNFRWGTMYNMEGNPYRSRKVCQITLAKIQGQEGFRKRFENCIFDCDNVDFLPVLFDPPRNGFNADIAPPLIVGISRRQT